MPCKDVAIISSDPYSEKTPRNGVLYAAKSQSNAGVTAPKQVLVTFVTLSKIGGMQLG